MLEDLDFADDIALMSSTKNHLQSKTNKTGNQLGKSRDEANANATKDGGSTSDVRKRIAMANGSFRRLDSIWKATNIGRKTKVSILKSLVLSYLLYGCETWKLTLTEERRKDTFQTKCLRRILKIRWQQHILNKTVLEMAEVDNISDEVRRRRWNWTGHILRKNPKDDCAVSLGWTLKGRRKRGRPKTTWRRMEEVERNLADWSSWNTARRAASDRKQCKENVKALCAS